MKLSTYILANRSQSVELPVPVDPVEASVVGNAYTITYHMTNEAIPAQKTYTTNRNTTMQSSTTAGEYLATQGYDCYPCNFGGNNSGTDVTLRPDTDLSSRYSECSVLDTKGAYTLTVGSLPAGNYVFEITQWIGADNNGWAGDVPDSVVQVINPKSAVIKAGEYGAIEGRMYSDVIRYAGANISQYQSPYYKGRVIKIRYRYAFTIESGDTTKVFKFGNGEAIKLSDLCTSIKMYDQDSSYRKGGVWLNAQFGFNIKIYTAR